MKKGMTAQKLRILLAVGMLLLLAGAGAGFVFGQHKLQEYATSISQLEADAKAGDVNIITLKNLEKTLSENSDVKAKADSIAVDSSAYPVAVINNITKIANSASVRLTSISYSGDGAATGSTGSATPSAATPNAIPGAATPTTPTVAEPTGVTKKSISVSVASPLSYDALMSFLRKIETNDMYLHVTQVSISKEDGNAVTTQPFTIEVYVK